MSVPNKLAGIPTALPEGQDRINWDQYFIMQAMLAAAKSKDDSTWVGVVLVKDNTVIATGFNGFPRGVAETQFDEWLMRPVSPHVEIIHQTTEQQMYGPIPNMMKDAPPKDLIEERWNKRPEKYRWVEHAERNAIYQAARHGFSTVGATMYFNTTGLPCSDCTRAVIQAGVTELVCRDIAAFEGKGEGTHYHCGDIEQTMLNEAAVTIRKIPDFAPDYKYTSRG